jgi:hypothetical protein
VKALEEKALGDGSEAATISNSLKVCVNRLSSSSGKNSCPLNTGIPIESLGIELEHHALIRAEYVGCHGPGQQEPRRYHFVTS